MANSKPQVERTETGFSVFFEDVNFRAEIPSDQAKSESEALEVADGMREQFIEDQKKLHGGSEQ